MARSVRAYVGLGANVGRPAGTLARAVAALAGLPGVRLRAVSWLYRTRPVGVLDQPDFRNAVVALDVRVGEELSTSALGLLGELKAIELRFGRTAGRRWGPRVLDLDLLLLGRARVSVERPPELAGQGALSGAAIRGEPLAPKLLQVPHRDVADRLFVLAPLSDLAPSLVPPGWHETVTTARRRLEVLEGEAAARAIGAWDPAKGRWDRPPATGFPSIGRNQQRPALPGRRRGAGSRGPDRVGDPRDAVDH